jgi:thiol-disulfide isomerase/thioredoxin
MTNEPNALQTPRTSFTTYAWAAALAALAGFAAVYVTLRGADNVNRAEGERAGSSTSQSSASAAPAVQALPSGPGSNPLSVGTMAAFVFKKSPEPLPETSFVDGSGKERSLKEWSGKTVLLNLWATWCAPCRKEMPALDRLQAELGSDTFEVVAVSVDKTGTEGAKKFLDQIKVTNLAVFADPTIRMGTTLKAIGMPSTLLIDREGREVGRLVGPAEWDSDEAKRLIKAVAK